MNKLWQVVRHFRSKRAFFYSTVVILVLLISLPAGLYLVLNKVSFFPKAAENKTSSLVSRKTPEYVPGEVLVKFRKQQNLQTKPYFQVKADARKEGRNIDKQAVSLDVFEPDTVPLSLRLTKEKFQVKSVEKVFKGASNPQAEVASLTQNLSREISKGQRKLNRDSLLKTNLSDSYKVAFDPKKSASDFALELLKSPEIEAVEPNYIYHATFTPNNPYFLDHYPDKISPDRDKWWNPPYDYQWDLKQIKMEQAWDIVHEQATVRVAIIDTGVDYTHPKLGPCSLLLLRSGGCKKFDKGYNFINDSDDPQDDFGHGTHVAGTIAASVNDGVTIAGMDKDNMIKILPIKALGKDGSGDTDQLAQAIYFAVKNGAKVVNMSWGGYGDSSILDDAIKFGQDSGVVFVASAGNESGFVSDVYPAAVDGVIAVSATDQTDRVAGYSNYGPEITVAAPGGQEPKAGGYPNVYNVLSLMASQCFSLCAGNYLTYPDSRGFTGVTRLSGTSMAAPHVSGLAALIFSQKPVLSAAEVKNVMINSADDLGSPGFDNYYGYGRINAFRALSDMNNSTPLSVKISQPYFYGLAGRKFDVDGKAYGTGFKNYQISYSNDPNCRNGSGRFVTDGVTIKNQNQPIEQDGLLATVELSNGSANGQYCLKLSVNPNDSGHYETVTPFFVNGLVAYGWPVRKGEDAFVNQAVADVNGDGKKEIVFENAIDQMLHVLDANGKELPGFPTWDMTLPGYSTKTPTVVGEKIFVQGSATGWGAQIYGWDGKTGNFLPHWSPDDWQVRTNIGYLFFQDFTTADLKLDGEHDIIYGEGYNWRSADPAKLHVFNSSGQYLSGWQGGVSLPDPPDPQNINHSNMVSSPLVANVSGAADSLPQIVVAYGGGIKGRGQVAVFKNDGTLMSHWFLGDDEILIKALIADVNGDGFPEIITSSVGGKGRISGWDGNGKRLWTYEGFAGSLVALADFDGNGTVDVLACDGTKCIALGKDGAVLKGFPTGDNSPLSPASLYTAVAKLKNGDILMVQDVQETMPSSGGMLGVTATRYNPQTGSFSVVDGFPIYFNQTVTGPIWKTFVSHPMIADLNNDGKLEVIAAVRHSMFVKYTYVLNTNLEYTDIPWSQVMGNERHTGAYETTSPIVTPVPSPVITPTPTPTLSPSPSPTALPGDLNGDNKVDVSDLDLVINRFTNVFDYNLVVGNYGKALNQKP